MHRPIDESGHGTGDGAGRGPVPPPYLPHPVPPVDSGGRTAPGDGVPDPGRVDPRVLGALLARHG
ncbi:hypothetical protein ABTY14_39660, partial [Streptomyces hydrogenans]